MNQRGQYRKDTAHIIVATEELVIVYRVLHNKEEPW
jgi:hypothetical protein